MKHDKKFWTIMKQDEKYQTIIKQDIKFWTIMKQDEQFLTIMEQHVKLQTIMKHDKTFLTIKKQHVKFACHTKLGRKILNHNETPNTISNYNWTWQKMGLSTVPWFTAGGELKGRKTSLSVTYKVRSRIMVSKKLW